MPTWNKRISQSRGFQVAIGAFGAFYLRLVWKTARFTIEPEDLYERIVPDLPVIVAMWHGQHFMMPFLRRPEHRAKVLISRHRDGEVNAITAARLGLGVVRGSGNHGARYDRKGGVAAFRGMLSALEEGYNMALTADVPKISRVCGFGIIKLGRASGRAIYPVAVATSHRFELRNWDRSVVNLPFGRGAIVAGDPVRVPRDTAEPTLECYRCQVEAGLNAVTARAYALVNQPPEDRALG
jgi:lysophospholipid acyltransferase (LPLAT)-like uncharacterized protein